MNIGIASDHRGIDKKSFLINFLENNGYNVINYGTDSVDSVDYPDYAFKIGEDVSNKLLDFGILICGSGIGMSIACNKVKGVRCGKINTIEDAFYARNDNNINVIAVGSSLENEMLKDIIIKFLTTPFSTEERHQRRVNKINNYES